MRNLIKRLKDYFIGATNMYTMKRNKQFDMNIQKDE